MPTWITRLLDLLAPEVCRLCAADHDGAAPWVCAACIEASPPPPPPACARCSLAHAPDTDDCGPMVHAATRYDVSTNVPAAVALRMLKYDGRRALAHPLARLVRARVRLPPDAVLVPVPLAAARLRRRGYNQAVLLGRQVARLAAVPFDPNLLVRTHEGPPQAALGRRDRLRNLEGTIAARRTPPSWRRVMLVDDVCTTGATLSACAAALHAVGVRRVEGMVVARSLLLSRPGPTR